MFWRLVVALGLLKLISGVLGGWYDAFWEGVEVGLRETEESPQVYRPCTDVDEAAVRRCIRRSRRRLMLDDNPYFWDKGGAA